MWMYRHAHLPGVPNPPVVPVDERVVIVFGPAGGRAGRRGSGAGAGVRASGYLQSGGGATRARRDFAAEERVRALAQRRAEHVERRRLQLRQQRVRELRQRQHESDVAAAAEERRRRWAEEQLRLQREAVLRMHTEDAGDRAEAERRARAARFERARLLRRRAALRRALGQSIRSSSLGTLRQDLGSSRANMLVRRARYLYGRSDLIHFVSCLGPAAL